MTRVNLLRTAPDHRRRTGASPDRRRGLLACSSILTLTACALVGSGWALHRDAGRLARERARVGRELSRLRAKAAGADTLARASEDLQRRVDMLAQLRAAQRAPVRILHEIARAVPGDCWLTAVAEDVPEAVRIEGRAPVLSSLFLLVERLEGSGLFRTVEVLDSHLRPDDADGDLIGFSLKAFHRTPAPAVAGSGVRQSSRPADNRP